MRTAQYIFEYTHLMYYSVSSFLVFTSYFHILHAHSFLQSILHNFVAIDMFGSCLLSACKCTACIQPGITAMLIIIANFSTKNAKTHLPAAKTNATGRVEGQI